MDTWHAVLDALPTLEEISFTADESNDDSYIELLMKHPVAKRLRKLELGHGKNLAAAIRKACPKAEISFY